MFIRFLNESAGAKKIDSCFFKKLCNLQLHIFFKKQLCVFFTADSSHYLMHISIKVIVAKKWII